MRHITAFRTLMGCVALSALGLTLASALPAAADPPPWAPAHGWRRKHEEGGEGYRTRSYREREEDEDRDEHSRFNGEEDREARRRAEWRAERQAQLERQTWLERQSRFGTHRLTRAERQRRARHLRRLRRQQLARRRQSRFNPLDLLR